MGKWTIRIGLFVLLCSGLVLIYFYQVGRETIDVTSLPYPSRDITMLVPGGDGSVSNLLAGILRNANAKSSGDHSLGVPLSPSEGSRFYGLPAFRELAESGADGYSMGFITPEILTAKMGAPLVQDGEEYAPGVKLEYPALCPELQKFRLLPIIVFRLNALFVAKSSGVDSVESFTQKWNNGFTEVISRGYGSSEDLNLFAFKEAAGAMEALTVREFTSNDDALAFLAEENIVGFRGAVLPMTSINLRNEALVPIAMLFQDDKDVFKLPDDMSVETIVDKYPECGFVSEFCIPALPSGVENAKAELLSGALARLLRSDYAAEKLKEHALQAFALDDETIKSFMRKTEERLNTIVPAYIDYQTSDE
ncbi:MAG: hypothetical protein NUW37_11625 [Planctomycetes bacterium]|nr:hypothetical protein [Planctomycetota bacterium]